MLERKPSQDKLSIREIQLYELDAVMAIEVKSFTVPWTRQSYVEMMRQDNVKLVGAYYGNVLVGYALYQFSPGEAELHNVAVDPNYRKKGIGRILIKHVFEWAKQNKIDKVFLQVRPSNVNAFHLYHKFGFTEIGRRKRYYHDDGEDAVIMVAPITS